MARSTGITRDIADLDRLRIDGLIVTGAEPVAATLPEEPFWHDLAGMIEWAKANTRSTIWSCLAAHAAVLHLDGIERQRLDDQMLRGLRLRQSGRHWLTKDIAVAAQDFAFAPQRAARGDLAARGYQLLTLRRKPASTSSPKSCGSQFIFFQGHPEYDALSLEREYLRDISRFLARQRDSYPAIPAAISTPRPNRLLPTSRRRARLERRPGLSVRAARPRPLRPDVAAGAAATAIFRNWLEYLSGGGRRRMTGLNVMLT